ncbi:hypothetical protein CDL12_10116 [Handroanthus impetiginosus]|uniref:BZIP domain-containing protein n=1 Tax=Handroanthus impetiginosus TaxID=429701 RepID=A0A2G9HI72_9LAMI|nr:hypothetical protein CDL12_10116 [Handroanthus impetiginosus]
MWSSSSTSSSSARSLSSSTSSTASPYSNNPKLNNSKTMEEVWKDITLASDLPHHHSSSRGIILQDFFSKDPSPAAGAASSAAFSPAPAPAPVVLTLSSAADQFGSMFLQPRHQPISHVSSLNLPFDGLIENGGGGAGRKRLQEFDRSSGDRRHKRMIKNRESAARSRARKQESAYTNELELEVAHLLEENARLKEQQKELHRAAAAQNQKKKGLHRTSTAPF